MYRMYNVIHVVGVIYNRTLRRTIFFRSFLKDDNLCKQQLAQLLHLTIIDVVMTSFIPSNGYTTTKPQHCKLCVLVMAVGRVVILH